MSDVVLTASGLGKRYRIGGAGGHVRYETLRDRVAGWLGRSARLAGTPRGRTVWALKGVSFQVARGEVVGLIGHNGAGKSTLLKILSRITEPTEGFAEIDGRVGSLLEVGTGFHPELTGRENIYLNGTILGMRRAEIDRQFDAIVSFAETEAFLDTSVKYYSTGMYMRLAFAVAAHLDPEILVIDEVLAVGDARFQRKCLGKVGDLAKQGRTVLFVSHNMGAVRSLCSRALVFSGGSVVFDGTTDGAIAHYLASADMGSGGADGVVEFDADEPESPDLALRRIRLLDSNGQTRQTFDATDPIRIEIEYEVRSRLRGARTTLEISTQEGEQAFVSTDHFTRDHEQLPGRYRAICTLPGGLLNRRMYLVGVGFDIPGLRSLLARRSRISFLVSGGGNHGSTYPEPWPGVVCPVVAWQSEAL